MQVHASKNRHYFLGSTRKNGLSIHRYQGVEPKTRSIEHVLLGMFKRWPSLPLGMLR
jgi:hypothetical protein